MVILGDHVNLFLAAVAPQDVQKLPIPGDPGREDHRYPGAEADQVEVPDAAQGAEIPLDDGVGIEEGVPARNEHVADLPVRADITDHIVEVARNLLIGQPDKALAEAVPAVHRALVGRKDHRRLTVFVLHPDDYGIVRLAAGVEGTAQVGLVQRGDAHPPDRVVLVLKIDQRQVIGSDGHGVLLQNFGEPLLLLWGAV